MNLPMQLKTILNESSPKEKHPDGADDDNSGNNNHDNKDDNNNGLNPIPSPTYAPSPVSFPPCDIWGNKRSVNLPGVMVRLEGFNMVECGELGRDGLNRLILSSECPLILDQLHIGCGCNPPYNVCRNGRPVVNPNAIVKFPGELVMQCGYL